MGNPLSLKEINEKRHSKSRLTAIEDLGSILKVDRKRRQIKFICECGNYIVAEPNSIISGNTISCGCYNKERSAISNNINNTGKPNPYKILYKKGEKIGECTFVKEVSSVGQVRRAIFICKCGKEFECNIAAIKCGFQLSCGCVRDERIVASISTHGNTRNRNPTTEYISWGAMIKRCNNKNIKEYKNYGGRGIKVCERWLHSFENFLADMGKRPSKSHSLDRYPNNDGDYEPNNCRWATKKEQCRNQRRTVMVQYNGQPISLQELCEKQNLVAINIYNRIFRYGYSLEEAIAAPKNYKRRTFAKAIK